MEDLHLKLKQLNLELTDVIALLERRRRETKQPKPKVNAWLWNGKGTDKIFLR